MNKYQQQPSEVIDYLIDLSIWIPENDTVRSTSVTAVHYGHDEHDGPVLLNVFVTDETTKKPKVWCANGVDGQEYKLTVLVTSSSGRIKEVDFRVKVMEQ